MLPERQRLRSGRDYSAVMRSGRRVGRSALVVHHVRPDPSIDRAGPRFGLIVSTAVGNAVVRHRVSRRLRHVLADRAAAVDPRTDIVVRALRPAADADSAELARQLDSALRRADLLREVDAR